MKLGIFTNVAATGATGMMAVSLTVDETEQSFTWVFQRYLDCFRVQPAVILTDGDPWMLRALATIMPDTFRMACIWHLSKNVNAHIHPLYTRNEQGWRTFMNKWWRIALETDEAACATWEEDWAALIAIFTQDTAASAPRSTALVWLAALSARRESWAARWTWSRFTAGCDSTQRTEAVNSAVKGYTTASMLLVKLLAALDSYNVSVQQRATTRQFSLARRAEQCPPSPLLESINGFVTPYAAQLVRAQFVDAFTYASVAEQRESGTVYLVSRRRESQSSHVDASLVDVENEAAAADFGCSALWSRTRTTTLAGCSCQYPKHWGLPCRHQLHLLIVSQAAHIPRALIGMLWRLQVDAVGHAQLAALLLRSPSYKANATAPAQHTLPERFALLISAFKPVAELGSVSDTAMSAVVAKVNELAASMRGNPSAVTGSGAGGRGTGGRGADGRGAGGRGIGGRGRGGRGAEPPAAGRGATAPTPFRRTCSVCRQPGHNKSTCPRQEALRGVGAAGDEEPLAVPLPVPTLDGDSGDEALPPVMPLPPALPLPGAPLAAPPPAPSRAQAHPAGGHTASFAHGSGGDVNVALGATALTALLGSGAHFSLDDAVRAGGVQMPPAARLVGNPVALRGKGRPKTARYKSASEGNKRKRS